MRRVVFDCDGNKAPAPDGYSMAFFQSNWEVVKSELLEVLMEFHSKGVISGITNETYISLIPKKLNSCREKLLLSRILTVSAFSLFIDVSILTK